MKHILLALLITSSSLMACNEGYGDGVVDTSSPAEDDYVYMMEYCYNHSLNWITYNEAKREKFLNQILPMIDILKSNKELKEKYSIRVNRIISFYETENKTEAGQQPDPIHP